MAGAITVAITVTVAVAIAVATQAVGCRWRHGPGRPRRDGWRVAVAIAIAERAIYGRGWRN